MMMGVVYLQNKKLNMHKLGRKEKFFMSADVSMLGHGCGVSQYPQFYDTI